MIFYRFPKQVFLTLDNGKGIGNSNLFQKETKATRKLRLYAIFEDQRKTFLSSPYPCEGFRISTTSFKQSTMVCCCNLLLLDVLTQLYFAHTGPVVDILHA